MKKTILFSILLALSVYGYAYDFSAVCESGQTLYYRILPDGNREVAVTAPHPTMGWMDYTKPQGDLVIPESVAHGGVFYMVTRLDDEALSWCDDLTSVVLPNTITFIGNGAFNNLFRLRDFTLPNSVTHMGDYVFNACSIENDVYNDKIFAYHPQNDDSPYVIPDGIEEIASGAFGYCPLSVVEIPNSVRKIGKGAFMYSNLKSAIIPDGVTTIEDVTFFFSGIHTITLPNSVTSIKKGAFSSCFRLDTIALPNSLQSIEEEAFRYCERLRSVVIPNSVTTIEEGAFSNCSSLTSVVLPNSVTSMGADVFENCRGLTEPVYNSHFFAYYPPDYASSYQIPDGVETILERVFQGCSNLDSIFIPNSVRTIKYQAFLQYGSLTHVSLPETLETIEDDAFRECYQLSTINLPNSLKYIGKGVFGDCDVLREPLFNDRYFAHFPKNHAATYSIPDGIQEVLDGAFVRCDSLVSLSFPNSVTKIGSYAVSNCPNLLEINIFSDTPPFLDLPAFNPWTIWPGDAFIFVPVGTLETYLNDAHWCYYDWRLAEMENILSGREMYYEIMNDDGSVTYQHLYYAADTTIGNERPKVVVRTNQIYDKSRHTEVTHEYIYENDGKVYWWNKTTEEFTTLYDFRADVGDEWDIKVGNETITVHVDAIEESNVLDSLNYRVLMISDANDIFSGSVVCGVGHLTSFFPEILMTQGKNYRVEGLRCYWRYGFLTLKYGDEDCDAIYEQYHHGVDENGLADNIWIYPNPTCGLLHVVSHGASLPSEYRITNIMGQTLMSGTSLHSNLILDVSSLPAGLYFLTIGKQTTKITKQ